MAVAAEVPGRYDVVINGQGYTFLRTLDGSYLTSGRHRAEYSYTPTFVERQNISNAYGDNAQDFFLTQRQRDWSRGEQQKFFRSGQDGRYWMGSNIDVSTPGQAKLSPGTTDLTFAAAVRGCARQGTSQDVVCASTTNLYKVVPAGTITDLGAHGLGAAPARWGVANDGAFNYLSTTAAGTVGVRRWDGASFTTFSATGADSLAFLNNTLYGYRGGAGTISTLVSYDTSGTATTLFTWKSAQGSPALSNPPKLHAFGGKLLIGFIYAQESSELWLYDGSGARRLEVFPENFILSDIEVLYGIAFIAGSFIKPSGANSVFRPAVLFFDGSQVGKVWQANDYNTVANTDIVLGPHPGLGTNDGRLVFTDETNGNVMAYDPTSGGVSSIGTFSTNTGDSPQLASTGEFFVLTRNLAASKYFPSPTYPSSGYVISSLFDFDSSLTKLFRGLTVEFDSASDGNGGTVDIAYQLNGVSGSWTSLATGVTSGTETTFPANTSGHAVSVKVTLNKGTSTSGPVLKSINLRSAPVLTSYRVRTYNLDLTSTDQHPTRLQDDSEQTLSGHEQAVNLQTAIQSPTPITIIDRFGSYTAVLEPDKCSILELHSDGGTPAKSGQFVATLAAREV